MVESRALGYYTCRLCADFSSSSDSVYVLVLNFTSNNVEEHEFRFLFLLLCLLWLRFEWRLDGLIRGTSSLPEWDLLSGCWLSFSKFGVIFSVLSGATAVLHILSSSAVSALPRAKVVKDALKIEVESNSLFHNPSEASSVLKASAVWAFNASPMTSL